MSIVIRELKKKKDKDYQPPETHPDLFQCHFTCCIVGPRNRGKSLLIRNLLLRKDLMANTFKAPHYIIVISPNIDVNGDFDELDSKNVYKFDSYDPELIDELIKVQSDIIKKNTRKRCPSILLVMDDILDSGCLNHHSKVEKVFSRGRHVNLNIILVSQHLNRISRTMRLNNDYFVMFLPNNETELEDFLEQYVAKPRRKAMSGYLKKMWDESIYNFVLVDFKTKDITRRFRKGFSEPIVLE